MPISTVYHLAKTERIPAVQIGRTWRFRRRDIEALEMGPGRAASVLVVDDDVTVLTFVSDLLQTAGHEVHTASCAAEADLLIRARQFDLLLVDVVLPDRSGVDLVKGLPAGYLPQRVILITAYADLSSVSELLRWGQLTILRKPLDPAQLVDCVATRLAQPAQEEP